MDWATLPKELLNTIYSFLTCSDLTSAVCVNSTWNSLASNDSTWKVSTISLSNRRKRSNLNNFLVDFFFFDYLSIYKLPYINWVQQNKMKELF